MTAEEFHSAASAVEAFKTKHRLSFLKADGVSFELRAGQQRLLDPALETKESVGLVAQTASGKTVIAAVLADKTLTAGGTVIICVPDDYLTTQTLGKFLQHTNVPAEWTAAVNGQNTTPEQRAEIYFSNPRVIIATAEVLANDTLSGVLSWDEVKLFIVDEAHHAQGDHAYVKLAELVPVNIRRILLSASLGTSAGHIMSVQYTFGVETIYLRLADESTVKLRLRPVKLDEKHAWAKKKIEIQILGTLNSIARNIAPALLQGFESDAKYDEIPSYSEREQLRISLSQLLDNCKRRRQENERRLRALIRRGRKAVGESRYEQQRSQLEADKEALKLRDQELGMQMSKLSSTGLLVSLLSNLAKAGAPIFLDSFGYRMFLYRAKTFVELPERRTKSKKKKKTRNSFQLGREGQSPVEAKKENRKNKQRFFERLATTNRDMRIVFHKLALGTPYDALTTENSWEDAHKKAFPNLPELPTVKRARRLTLARAKKLQRQGKEVPFDPRVEIAYARDFLDRALTWMAKRPGYHHPALAEVQRTLELYPASWLEGRRVAIFAETRRQVFYVARWINARFAKLGLRATWVSGGKSGKHRRQVERNFRKFNKGVANILCATDKGREGKDYRAADIGIELGPINTNPIKRRQTMGRIARGEDRAGTFFFILTEGTDDLRRYQIGEFRTRWMDRALSQRAQRIITADRPKKHLTRKRRRRDEHQPTLFPLDEQSNE